MRPRLLARTAPALVMFALVGLRAGTAWATVTVNPAMFDFGDVDVGGSSAAKSFTISNDAGSVTIASVSVTSGDAADFVITGPGTTSLSGNDSTTFTVACSPTQRGKLTATITVDTDAEDPTVGVDCNGVEPPAIQVMPSGSTPFGQVAVGGGGSSTRTFTVTNLSADSDLTLSSIAVSGDADFSITSPSNPPPGGPDLVLGPGQSLDVDVTFVPVALGARSATLTITSDDPDQPTVTRNLTGTGVDQLRIEDTGGAALSSYTFNTIPVGVTDGPLIIEVCNRGVNDLLILSATLVGDDFTENVGIGANTPVGGGACVSYQVSFTPNSAGSKTGTVTFTSDASTNPTKDVSLAGVAQSVAYTFDPAAQANFGDVDINGSPGQLNISFTNSGTAALLVQGVQVCSSTGCPSTSTVYSESYAGGAKTLAKNQHITIPVTADPGAVGSTTGTLRVTFKRFPGQPDEYADLPLTVAGISANIALDETAIDFQEADVDLPPETATITVTNTGTAPLGIDSISITNNADGVFSVVSPAGPPYADVPKSGSMEVVVQFQPVQETAGEPTAVLVIETSVEDVNIPLDGRGIDRRINLASDTVNFPATFRSPATPTTVAIDIGNTGSAPLNISMVVVTDDDDQVFSVVTPSVTQIPGQSTGTVEVQFNPTRLKDGGFTGTLVINNDDDNAPMASLTLTGMAILPMISVDPGEIDYGQIGVGVTSEVGLEVPVIDIVNLDPDRSFSLRELRVVDRAGQPIDPSLFRIRGLEEPHTVSASGRIGLEVEFNPNRPGDYEFLLQVFAEADPLPITTAPIRAQAVDVRLRGGGCRAGGGDDGLAAGLGLLLLAVFLRRARRRRGRLANAAAASLILVAATAGAASAQATRNLELGTFRPALGSEADFITVDNARVGRSMAWTAGLGLAYANRVLVVESPETSMVDMPVENRVATDLYGSFAFLGRYEVGARLALLSQSGTEPRFSSIRPADGFAIGDVGVELKAHLVTLEPFALAAAAFATAPTATDEEFAGAAGFSGGARAIAALGLGRVRVGANIGYRARQNGRLADVVQGDELMYGAAASYLFRDELQAIGELVGSLGLEGTETGGISPLEVNVGVRYHIRPEWGLVAGLGRGLISGIGAPAVRGFLLFTVSPQRAPRKVAAALAGETFLERDPAGDGDGDGLLNAEDRCPASAEDADGFQDGDGCPDVDNDGDGLIDEVDRCPVVAEDEDHHLDDDGCPDADNDGDEIPDARDRCPDVPEDQDGFEDDDGCDDFDNDHDGVPDLMDACPKAQETINGKKDDDGCPDRGSSAVMLLDGHLSILEPIAFVRRTARLGRRSTNVLGQVAATLRAHPEFVKVAIEVYVDPQGKRDQELSEQRAKAILEAMVNRGVDAKRLELRPKGSSNPVRTKGKNRARYNDRVVFVIEKTDPSKR